MLGSEVNQSFGKGGVEAKGGCTSHREQQFRLAAQPGL